MKSVGSLLLKADARRLDFLPDGCVQCCVTSPPFFGLRDYGHDRQIGLEASPDEFVAGMVAVFRGVRRVMREDGTLWLNLGDSYAGGKIGRDDAVSLAAIPLARGTNGTHCRSGGRNKGGPEGSKATDRAVPEGSKPKNLLGIPWRVALALQADGWYLRSDIIWCLSGGTRVYAKTRKGEMPMTIKDLVRLNPATVRLWNGEKWTQVLGWNRSPDRGEPLELLLRSGERIGCTRGHVWPTQRGNIRADELMAGDVIRRCRLPEPRPPRNPSGLDDDLVGWFVGLYVAEGSMDTGGTIQISGHVKEAERFAKLCRLAEAFDGHCRIFRAAGKSCTINLDSPVLRGILEAYVGGRVAADKHLKVRAWQRSDAFLRAVLDGYLSGDGHYDATNERWRLGFCQNDNLAADLRTLSGRLGFALRLVRCQHQMGDRKFPGYRGQIKFRVSDHHSSRDGGEVIAIENSRARQFWDIGVADDPHLFALASGVLTHNSKPNPMPESVTDRPTKAHEYLFLLTKSERYYYDPDAVRELCESSRDRGRPNGRSTHESFGWNTSCGTPDAGRNLRSVWTVATTPFPGAHFATFPPKLIEPCIKAGTSEKGCCPACGAGWVREVERPQPPSEMRGKAPGKMAYHTRAVKGGGGAIAAWYAANPATTLGWRPSCSCPVAPPLPCLVLDPFGGAGTTPLVAVGLGRRAIACDINPEYLAMARRRIDRPHAPIERRGDEPLPLFGAHT